MSDVYVPAPTTFGVPNSVLYNTFLLAGTQALSILTAPGPKRLSHQDFSYNPGDASDPWSYICGTNEITPHFITDFDFASKKVKNDVGAGDIAVAAGIGALTSALAAFGATGGPLAGGANSPAVATAAVIGGMTSAIVAGLGQLRTSSYRYYNGFLYGISHGPIDAITGVKVSERLVSTGAPAGTSFLIDDPQAWGGDHQDGGVYAMCDIIAGNFWPIQQPNAYLISQLGTDVASYNGKALFLIGGPSRFRESGFFAATAGNAPALRPVRLRVTKFPNNLGVPEFKNVSSGDANIAECMFEWLTSPVFGAKKINTSKIYLDDFRAGAETHFNEGLGVSLEFNSSIDVETALDTFQSLGDVLLWGRFRDGLIHYKPIRRDYVIPDLRVFRRGPDGTSNPNLYNVVKVTGFTPGNYESTANDYKFEYTDRENNFLKTSRHIQDTANRYLTKQTRSLSQRLEGVSTGPTAALVGTREMRAGSYPRPGLTLHTNRDGQFVEIGDPIKFIDLVDNYTKILRVAEIEGGDETSSIIKLICAEDVFGVSASAFPEPDPSPSNGDDPIVTAIAAAHAKVIEAPHFLGTDDDPRLLVMVGKPNNAVQTFDTWISDDGGTIYTQKGTSTDFAITGIISEAMLRLTDAVFAGDLTFTPTNAFDATRLSSALTADIENNGENVLYWEDTGEFMAVEDVIDNGDGTYTLQNIWRAVHPYDSVPAPHAINSRVWFFTYGRLVTTTYAPSTATRTKVLPKTVSDTFPIASATATLVTTDTRAIKPNPVRNVLINSGYLTDLIGPSDNLQVDWNETNRLSEGLVIKQTEPGVDPEDLTTYTVRFYATEGVGNVLLRTESGLTLPTATLTTAEEVASGGYLGHLSESYRVEIDVVRDATYTSTTYIREVQRAALQVPVITVAVTVVEPAVMQVQEVPVITVGTTVEPPEIPIDTDVLASQVLDWQYTESNSAVGDNPDALMIESFEPY